MLFLFRRINVIFIIFFDISYYIGDIMFFGPWHFWRHKRRIFRKGEFKYIVLYLLEKKPMSGYDIIKELEKLLKNTYIPSPGLVYPTLEMLEEAGYIVSEKSNGKKIYRLTDEGKKILDERREEITEILDYLKEQSISDELHDISDAVKKLMRTIFVYYPDIDSDKAKEIISIIEDARRKIVRLMEEGQNP